MRYPHGLPGWIDLQTPDPDGAKVFYGDLFGWVAEDVPTDAGPAYSMMYRGGIAEGNLVCGLGPMAPPQVEAGMPSVWATYVLVGDIDAVVAAAPGAGGSILMPAMDIRGQGRLAMVADPSSAAIGLWQPGGHEGADLFNVPNTWVWSDLQSHDLAAALPFYEELFGWRWERVDPSGASDYVVAHLDAKADGAQGVDTSVAGAMPMPPGVPQGTPSVWMMYIGVEDCDVATARVTELGGRVEAGPMDAGGMRMSVVADPFGAYFQIMTVPAATP